MNTQKVYAVVSKTGRMALTFVGWVGYRMDSFDEKALYNQAYDAMTNSQFELCKDNKDSIQIFETAEKAKAVVDKLRSEANVQLGNLKLLEIELAFNSQILNNL